MDLKEAILKIANEFNSFDTATVVKRNNNKFSRQYTSRLLGEMVDEGKLVKSGSTKNTQYSLPSKALWLNQVVREVLDNNNLNEDVVLGRVQKLFLGYSQLPTNLKHIFDYSFSEMLNNAIEHSLSDKILIEVFNNEKEIGFVIKDFGIGIFANVMKKRNLSSEIESIQDILKGKTTTALERHSGEGVFFTSKAADLFILDSHKLRLRVDGLIPDVFIEELHSEVQGTYVMWEIGKVAKKELSEIFRAFQVDDSSFVFDKTSVLVKLFTMDTDYISRSQARRLLYGLEKFSKIVLDFENVKTIGQGFADEIFRIFVSNNPGITIEYVNAVDPVEFMIKHAKGKTD